MHITLSIYLSIYLSFYYISIYITLINIQNTYKTYTSSKKSETLFKKNGKGLYKLKLQIKNLASTSSILLDSSTGKVA